MSVRRDCDAETLEAEAPAQHAPRHDLSGSQVWLDRFEVGEALGSGASAAVFAAFDRKIQRRVALKVIRDRRPHALARLKAEFRSLADIVHPNLVGMHELFVTHELAFLSMDLVQGRTFQDHLRAESRSPEVLRSCLLQLTGALQQLHAAGGVHCDLKPDNVLLDADGHLTVVDFGLVSWRTEAALREGQGFQGTPAYAAPEQHDPARISPACDWYAVGGMLYEALCGQRPFAGNARELLLHKARHAPAPLTAALQLQLPAEWLALSLRLMEPDPERRADGDDILAVLGERQQVTRGAAPRFAPLAGRELELARLARGFEPCTRAAGAALLIRGESGIGKTALTQRFGAELRASGAAQVFEGKCFVAEAVPYNALDGVIDSLARQLLGARRELPVRSLGVLSQVFPALRELDAATASSQPGSLTPGAVFRALRELLSTLAGQRPVLVMIDDVQWADADSLELLSALFGEPIRGVCLLAVVSVQETAAESSWGAGIAWTDVLSLGPLNESATAELVRHELPRSPDELVSQIVRSSRGQPLLACALIEHSRSMPRSAAVSGGLDAAIGARLHTLSSPAREALELICEAGERLARRSVFDCVAELTPGALRELRLSRLVRESWWAQDVQLEPYHAGIGRAVTRRLSEAHRRALHARLAEHLLQHDRDAPERSVQHYVRAGELRKAGLLAELAAERAARALALHRTAALLALALEHAVGAAEQQRLRLLTAQAHARAGAALAAAEHYEYAAAAAVGPARDELMLQAFMAYCISGHVTRGRALVEQVGQQAGVSLGVEQRGPLRGTLSLLFTLLAGLPRLRGQPWARRPVRDPQRARALRVLWSAVPALAGVDGRTAFSCAARALSLAAEQGEAAIYAQALSCHLVLIPGVSGRTSASTERRLARARQVTQRHGDFWDDAFVRMAQATAALSAFELARAVELCLDIAQLPSLRTPFSVSVRTGSRLITLVALYWLGRLTQLGELCEAWLEDALDGNDRRQQFAFRTMRCYDHLRRDRPDAALAEVRRAQALGLDYIQGAGSDPWWFAGVALYAGQPELAAATCERQRAHYGLYAAYSATTRALWNLSLGGCAAAQLRAHGDDRDNHARLRRETRLARINRARIARPAALQLMATRASLQGRLARVEMPLSAACAAYRGLGLGLHAASLQLALARHTARPSLEREALQTLRAAGIVDPWRWSAMNAPGLLLPGDDQSL